MEKLDYLIEYLLKEDNRSLEDLPTDEIRKKRLWRSLCNIREANPISDEYLKIESEFLQEELNSFNITNVSDIENIKEKYNSNLNNANKICLWQGDITKLNIGAIINAANSQGLGCFIPCHNCIDNQINTYAGVCLRLECDNIMKNLNYNLETGKAIITNAYNLPCENVIHTVGPIIEYEVTENKKKELADCYINSLRLALDNGIKTIAFPCISTGVFKFPKDLAAEIAIKTVDEFLNTDNNSDKFDKIIFNLYSDEDVSIYESIIRR